MSKIYEHRMRSGQQARYDTIQELISERGVSEKRLRLRSGTERTFARGRTPMREGDESGSGEMCSTDRRASRFLSGPGETGVAGAGFRADQE